MRLRLGLCLVLGAAALLGAATASGAPPRRIAVVRPAHPGPILGEAVLRLQAELLSAGFTVILVDAESASAAAVAATITLVATGHGAVADVAIADEASHATVVRRVDSGATAESSQPAALAIRAVELLRGGLLPARSSTRRVAAAPPPDRAVPAEDWDLPVPARRRPPPSRPLLRGATVEAGLTAIYGLGGDGGRLAPTLRFAYGAGTGLAGRLTLLGPTPTDQIALIELAHAFAPSWPVLAPVVSLGAGGCHAHLDDTANARFPRLRTEAWGGVLSAGAGLAVRAMDRAAFLVDAHALFVELGPRAFVGGAPASGKQLVMTGSLGVVAGF